jgi:hypothetical protein
VLCQKEKATSLLEEVPKRLTIDFWRTKAPDSPKKNLPNGLFRIKKEEEMLH